MKAYYQICMYVPPLSNEKKRECALHLDPMGNRNVTVKNVHYLQYYIFL